MKLSKIKIVIISSCFIFSLLNFSKAETVLNTIFDTINSERSQERCSRTVQEKNIYEVDASCLLSSRFPILDDTEIIDEIFPLVSGFSAEYDLVSKEFLYSGSKPILQSGIQVSDLSTPTDNQRLSWILAHYTNRKIYISKQDIARTYFQHMFFTVARRQIAEYGDCSKQNYLIALKVLDGKVIQPGTQYRINDDLAGRSDYCMGSNPGKYQFYQGVCGASTQLFRISLLHPEITIEKRSPHSQRYTKYYSSYVFGDDAAIYEDLKSLVIRNNSGVPFFLKTLGNKDEMLLIGISPKKYTSTIEIIKKQTGTKEGTLEKNIINTNLTKYSMQKRISKYSNLNTSQN